MQPFIGGALTGIAGFATATYNDQKITESKFSPELKQPRGLDAKQGIRELNDYFLRRGS